MSIRIVSLVWGLKIPRDEKLVLLAYADHADDAGGSIHPSVRRIAKMTNYHPRSVQVITRKLQREGLLLDSGRRPHGTRCWRIPLERLQPKDCGAEPEAEGMNLDSPLQPDSPLPQDADFTGEMNPISPGGCSPIHPGDESQFTRGVNRDSLNPSLEPSLKPPEEPPQQPPRPGVVVVVPARRDEIFQTYTREIGPLTRTIRTAINAWLKQVPPGWIVEAIRQAAYSNCRRWNYVNGVLENWKKNGQPSFKKGSHEEHPASERRDRETLSPLQQAADTAAARRINEMSRLRRGRIQVAEEG